MKNEKNIQNASSETSQNDTPEYEVVLTFSPNENLQKLVDALRQDMRRASDDILRCRSYMDTLANYDRASYFEKLFANTAISYLDDALAALDCTDHIEPQVSDDATP